MDRQLKIGVFGVFRGTDYIRELRVIPNAKVTAICEKNEYHIKQALQFCDADVKVFDDYGAMLNSGIDAVILCNTFDEHAPAAIEALKKGIAVLSETIPAATLKECVELVEAVEETKGFYALAENYPFFKANMEMRRVYQSGKLGAVSYAEGEYVHPMDGKDAAKYCPSPKHWRAHLPQTYYMTHALSPLMYITDLMPKRVIGKLALGGNPDSLNVTERIRAGLMLVEMDSGALFRIFGSASFGPMGNWFRLGCDKGGIESVRGSNDLVRLVINPWLNTEGEESFVEECTYLPKVTDIDKRSTHSWRRDDDHGHWGGDQWMISNFVDDVLNARKPFMDVYRAAALSATGIIGWRSVLEDSRQMDIPDIRIKAERDKVRNDDLSPFVRGDREPDLPCKYNPEIH